MRRRNADVSTEAPATMGAARDSPFAQWHGAKHTRFFDWLQGLRGECGQAGVAPEHEDKRRSGFGHPDIYAFPDGALGL